MRIPTIRNFGIPLSSRSRRYTVQSELDNAAAHTDCDRLSAIACAQLLHYVFDVDLNGLFRDEQLFGNVTVTVAACDLPQHVDFALGECFISIVLCQLGCYLRSNRFLPGMDF